MSKVDNFYDFQERLDFSCAMFGPDGGLVANAPHIPVHLGAMQETIRYQVTCFELVLETYLGPCQRSVMGLFMLK